MIIDNPQQSENTKVPASDARDLESIQKERNELLEALKLDNRDANIEAEVARLLELNQLEKTACSKPETGLFLQESFARKALCLLYEEQSQPLRLIQALEDKFREDIIRDRFLGFINLATQEKNDKIKISYAKIELERRQEKLKECGSFELTSKRGIFANMCCGVDNQQILVGEILNKISEAYNIKNISEMDYAVENILKEINTNIRYQETFNNSGKGLKTLLEGYKNNFITDNADTVKVRP